MLGFNNINNGINSTGANAFSSIATGNKITSGDAQLDLSGLPRDEHGYAIAAISTYDPPTAPLDEDGQGTPYAVYGYGAQMAEVEVDTRLGTVKVRHIHAAPEFKAQAEDVLEMIRRRPVTLDDIAAGIGAHRNEISKHIEALLQ